MPNPSRLAWPLCLSLAFAAGCDDGTPRQGRLPSSPPSADSAGERLAWRGLMPCADCDGIDTLLEIGREPGPRYRLVEVFLADGGEVRFEEEGRWLRDGSRLRLFPDGGGERRFDMEPDGRLLSLEAQGESSDGPARVLEPVTPHAPP